MPLSFSFNFHKTICVYISFSVKKLPQAYKNVGESVKNPLTYYDNNLLSLEIIKYKKEQGLPSNEIYGILEGNNRDLWISTNNGISNYDITKDKFSNLGLNDGLQALNFRKNAFFKAQDGTMYFGGINGFNKFNPDGFQKNSTPPKVEIVGFKVFNKDVEVNEEILGKAILDKEISETRRVVRRSVDPSGQTCLMVM